MKKENYYDFFYSYINLHLTIKSFAIAGLSPSPILEIMPKKDLVMLIDKNKIRRVGKNYITISLHAEGGQGKQISNRDAYDNHVNKLERFISAFEALSPQGKLNIEVNNIFALMAIEHEKAGNNYLTRKMELGHSVYLHGDIGGQPDKTIQQFEQDLITRKQIVEHAIGQKIKGASGVCGHLPWIELVKKQGIKFVSSMVNYCMKSHDPANLPSEYSWVYDCESPAQQISETQDCHGIFPPKEMTEYGFTPFTLSNSKNWINNMTPYFDENASKSDLMIFPSLQVGKLACLYQEVEGECIEDDQDLDVLDDIISRALDDIKNFRKTNPAPDLYLGFVLSIGYNYTEEYSKKAAAVIDRYIQSGDLHWQSYSESYEEL